MQSPVMHWIDMNHVALRAELRGVGPPLVLLHEMGGTLESWDYVVPLLTGRQILRYDSRGAGLSQKLSAPVTLDDFTADLAALLDALAIPGKVALAGVAVGAAVALRFAARHPDRTAAVLAMAPATGLAPERRQEALDLAARIEREGMRSRVLERLDHSFPEQYRTNLARFAAFRGRSLANDPRSYGEITRMLAAMDLTADLPRITCPVRVLAGATDRTRPASLVRPVAEAIAGAEFAEIASGHVMPMLTPELVATELDGFLRRVGIFTA